MHFWTVHLPAVTGDAIQQEDGLGLHLHGTVLLGDFVIQAWGKGDKRRNSWTDRGNRSRPGLVVSHRPGRSFLQSWSCLTRSSVLDLMSCCFFSPLFLRKWSEEQRERHRRFETKTRVPVSTRSGALSWWFCGESSWLLARRTRVEECEVAVLMSFWGLGSLILPFTYWGLLRERS